MMLDPAEVEVGTREGFFWPDKAVALGRLMAVDGQRDPIKVVANKKGAKQPWRLVVGMHRLHGCIEESMLVAAIEVLGKPEDLKDMESSENLHRRPLGPLERAKFTAALVQAAQERIARQHGQLSHQKLGAKLRWQRVKEGEERVEQALQDEVGDACAKIAQAYGWEESVGEALGMSRRTIHNDLRLFRLLIEPFPDLAEQLARHPVVGENASQLKTIADVKDEAKRREIIVALLDDHGLNAEDARINAGVDRPDGPTPLPHQKHVNAVVGNLDRLTAVQQKRHLTDFVAALKSAEVKRMLRDMLDEQLEAADAR